jgi:hypothetical protein
VNNNPTRWLIFFSIIIGALFIGTFALVASGIPAQWLNWD